VLVLNGSAVSGVGAGDGGLSLVAKPVLVPQGILAEVILEYEIVSRDTPHVIRLEWESSGMSRGVVPSRALFAASALASSPFTLQVAPLSSFGPSSTTSPLPSLLTAGVPLAFTVYARDKFGNALDDMTREAISVLLLPQTGQAVVGAVQQVASGASVGVLTPWFAPNVTKTSASSSSAAAAAASGHLSVQTLQPGGVFATMYKPRP